MSYMRHSRKYGIIARRLIKTLEEFGDIAASEVRIAYLSCDKEKTKDGKTVYGQCVKVNPLYSWCCRYDFFIIIYEPNIVMFTDDQIETLIRHELHHVGVDFDGNEIRYYIVPHDVEEFRDIIRDKGLDWSD